VNPFFGSTDELLAMVVIYLDVDVWRCWIIELIVEDVDVDDSDDVDDCDVVDSTAIGEDDITTMEPWLLSLNRNNLRTVLFTLPDHRSNLLLRFPFLCCPSATIGSAMEEEEVVDRLESNTAGDNEVVDAVMVVVVILLFVVVFLMVSLTLLFQLLMSAYLLKTVLIEACWYRSLLVIVKMLILSSMMVLEAEEFIIGAALIAAMLLLLLLLLLSLFIIIVVIDDIFVFWLKVPSDGVVDSYIIELNMSISLRDLLSLFSNVS